MMPSGKAQAELIKSTYARAGLDLALPEDRPQYFQAHGTGTAAGDVSALVFLCLLRKFAFFHSHYLFGYTCL